MKSIIFVALALVAVAVAAPLEEPPKILRSNFDHKVDGGYESGYETENGIVVQETGEIKEVLDEENKPHSVITVRGTFSYINQAGETESINYYADETGYHAEGKSIPKTPEATS